MFDAEFACAHAPGGGACGWRKPGAGHDPRGGRRLALDLRRSLIAGDKLTDIEAGAAAGASVAPSMSRPGRGRRAERSCFLAGADCRHRALDDLRFSSPCAS